jgi:hypothetical protein
MLKISRARAAAPDSQNCLQMSLEFTSTHVEESLDVGWILHDAMVGQNKQHRCTFHFAIGL